MLASAYLPVSPSAKLDYVRGKVTVLAENSDRKSGARKPAAKPDDAALGTALRSVYQKTVEERVPDEFLDLLGKLD